MGAGLLCSSCEFVHYHYQKYWLMKVNRLCNDYYRKGSPIEPLIKVQASMYGLPYWYKKLMSVILKRSVSLLYLFWSFGSAVPLHKPRLLLRFIH